MAERRTFYDRILIRIKDNPILASLIALGVMVVALATLTDSLRKLAGLMGELRPTAAVDISGRWKVDATEKTPVIYFNFRVADNKLFGTVLLPSSPSMPNGESWITDGKVVGDRVSFTTKHEYVKQFERIDSVTGQGIPRVTAESIAHYQGRIRERQIDFTVEKESGYYTEFTAKKIIDLTERLPAASKAKRKISDFYALMYTLPGHDGGVCSLSFGPDKGRFPSGGLRLASGGAEDGQMRFWDTATAENRDNRSPELELGKGSVTVGFRPHTREGGVDLQAVGVFRAGHTVAFINRFFQTNYISGGQRNIELAGKVGLVAISEDLSMVAIAETGESAKSTISLRKTTLGGLARTLTCRGPVLAVGLSGGARVVASAEAVGVEGTALRLWDTETGEVRWDVSCPPICALAFNPDGSLLVSGGANDRSVSIWDVASGSLRGALAAEHAGGIAFLAFTDDGALLASAGVSPNTIELWNMPAGTLRQVLESEGRVGALAFSRDGRLLAAGGADNGLIKIWAKPKQ